MSGSGEDPTWASYRPRSQPLPEPGAAYTESHFGPTTVSEYDRGPYSPDGVAVAALVVSLLGFLTAGVGFLVALPLSIVGIQRTSRRPGRGFAIAGLVISLLGTLIILAVVVFMLWLGSVLWMSLG